jgi:hypothetical protein
MLAGRSDVRAGALRIQGNELSRTTLWVLNCIPLDLCGDWGGRGAEKLDGLGLVDGKQAVKVSLVRARCRRGEPKRGHACCLDRDPDSLR